MAQLNEVELFQMAYIDFTELRFASGRHKAQRLPIIGHVSKMAYGRAVGEASNGALAL